jgi:hypothetical protein
MRIDGLSPRRSLCAIAIQSLAACGNPEKTAEDTLAGDEWGYVIDAGIRVLEK